MTDTTPGPGADDATPTPDQAALPVAAVDVERLAADRDRLRARVKELEAMLERFAVPLSRVGTDRLDSREQHVVVTVGDLRRLNALLAAAEPEGK